MINKIIKNRYEIIQFLGRGAFGETYLAKDLDFPNHPLRVVKVLRPLSFDPEVLKIARNLFAREAEVLSKIGKHDLIPELFAYFEENQEFYLVQEWVDGNDLTQEISKSKIISETEVIKLIQDILIPLEYLHQNKVIHRDLKPSNLMRRRSDGKIIIIDFGGVKQIATTGKGSPQATIIGTPGYQSPEQTQGLPELASDIYAVGIIAIEALTGEFPIPPDWKNNVSINAQLLNILQKMVAVDVKYRYPSATAALNALKNLIPTSKSSSKTVLIPTQIYKASLWQISLAIAVAIGILSVSFNINRLSNSNSQSPPPGWTW